MMRRWWLWLACWLVLGCAMAQGQQAALNIGADDSYSLSPHFMFLEDKERKLTLDDVCSRKPRRHSARCRNRDRARILA